MMEGFNFKAAEGLLIIAAVAIFGFMQFRSLRRDRAEMERRRQEKAQERDKP